MDENINFSESTQENQNSGDNFSDEFFNYSNFTLTKEEKQKKEIKKATLTAVIPLIIVFVLSYAWSYIWSFIMNFLYGLGITIESLTAAELTDTIQIAFSTLLFTLPFIIPLKLSGKTVSNTVPLSKPREKGLVLPFLLVGIGFCEFANIAVSYAGSIFETFGVNYSVDFGDNGKSFFGVILSFLATAVVPALVEEFAMRGIVMGTLLPYGEGFAVMISAMLFGVMHGNFEQMPFAFLVGLVLGLVRIKTGTLWICVLIHFSNNFVSVLIDYFYASVSNDLRNISYTLILALFLLLGILGIILLCKRSNDGKIFKLDNGFEDLSESKKYKWFFTSPATVIFIAAYLYRSLMYFIV